MSSTLEPTSVLPANVLPTKPATRAVVEASPLSMDGSETSSPLDGVNVESGAMSAGDADDLIARLADEQINQLLAAEDDGTPAAPAAAPIVTSRPPEPAPFVERRQQPPADPTAFPASFSPPGTRPAIETSPAEAFSSAPVAASPAPIDVHEAMRSDAAAVAAELADDLSRSPARVAATPTSSPRVEATRDESTSPVQRAMHAIGVVPTAIVDVINLPVRAANDAIREAIGAVAIVTLANAAALLLYLMLFR